jgi:hypothetical protein
MKKVFFGNFGFRGAGNLAAGSVAKDNSGVKLSREPYGDIAIPPDELHTGQVLVKFGPSEAFSQAKRSSDLYARKLRKQYETQAVDRKRLR